MAVYLFWRLESLMGNVSKVKAIFKTVHLNPEPSIWDALPYLVPFVKSKKREKTHGGVLLLVKLQAEACNVA